MVQPDEAAGETAGEAPSASSLEGDVPARASQAPQDEPKGSPVERPLRKNGADGAEQGNTKASTPTTDFDWDTYVAHLREHHVALTSILAKCKAESDDTTLTIYAGTAFWKKKLDTAKYQPILNQALTDLGWGALSLETVPTPQPPKDSQAAAIAAMMGGGEEVSLED